jgi:hypothetical protein
VGPGERTDDDDDDDDDDDEEEEWDGVAERTRGRMKKRKNFNNERTSPAVSNGEC